MRTSIVRAVGLLEDIRPNETVALAAGLGAGGLEFLTTVREKASTISERIAALLTKVVLRANLNVETFGEVAETFGITATVEEHDQTRAQNCDHSWLRARWTLALRLVGHPSGYG